MGLSLITIQQGVTTTVHARTMWISWSEGTVLTALEQLYYVATAAVHLYSRTIVWFYIFQWGDRNRIAGKSPSHVLPSCRTQIEPLHTLQTQQSSQTSTADRCQGRLSENNRRRREKAEKLAANRRLGVCCLLNVKAWKSECQTRQVCLLKQATWIPLNMLNWVFQHCAFTLTLNVNNKHVLGALLHNGYGDLGFYNDPQHSRSLKLSALVLSLWLNCSHLWPSPPPTQACSAVLLSGFVCQGHLILQKICWLLFQDFYMRFLVNVVNYSRKK